FSNGVKDPVDATHPVDEVLDVAENLSRSSASEQSSIRGWCRRLGWQLLEGFGVRSWNVHGLVGRWWLLIGCSRRETVVLLLNIRLMTIRVMVMIHMEFTILLDDFRAFDGFY